MNRVIVLIVFLSLSGIVFSQFDPGKIGDGQTICYGTAPVRLSFIDEPSGDPGAYSYRWQRSNTNDDKWSDITGPIGAVKDYSPPVLGRTTSFRCKVTDESQNEEFTNPVKIIVLEDLDAGAIQSPQMVFAGTRTQLMESVAASGGSGPDAFTYRWQRSSDGLYWSNIEAITNQEYYPSGIISDQWFKRWVVDPRCGSVATKPIKVSTSNLTLFGNDIPEYISVSLDEQYEFGTVFRVLSSGIIPVIRLYSGDDEGGIHIIRFWRITESEQEEGDKYELIAGPFYWDIERGSTGWKEYNLDLPLQVEGGCEYMLGISTSDDGLWSESQNYMQETSNDYILYLESKMGTFGELPEEWWYQVEGFFRDVVFIPYSSGSIGSEQTICYNTTPESLIETEEPTGAAGYYTFQWQSSNDGSEWTDINSATAANYSPSELTRSTWFRRKVISDYLVTTGEPVLITVNPRFSLAQLLDGGSIYTNTGTNLRISLEGGTGPYSIDYKLNDQLTETLPDYNNRDDIFTGILNGSNGYEIIGVTDANGCSPESLGTPLTINANLDYADTITAKAVVLVNSSSDSYSDYNLYIKPYFDWFGIPYDEYDVHSLDLPELGNYAIIVLGHKNVYSSEYPITDIENAVSGGTGFYSFDPHFFDYTSAFAGEEIENLEFLSHFIGINSDHFITKYHENDQYDLSNSTIELNRTISNIFYQKYELNEAVNLAWLVTEDAINLPILQAATYGEGHIIAWSFYGWMDEFILGPIRGMDDLLWRSIVWAARKPFVMQGVQPMLTMRVDDVDGRGGYDAGEIDMKYLEWLKISNEFGYIPWCGTFIDYTTDNFYSILRDLVNSGLATASPHSFDYEDNFIFHPHPGKPDDSFDSAENVRRAWKVFADSSIAVSMYMVPHWYVMEEEALAPLAELGVKFIGSYLPYGKFILDEYYPGDNWAMAGPYREVRTGFPGRGNALFYSSYVDWSDNEFFICLTEIQDDGGYEWYPDERLDSLQLVISRGIRHLRRAINSMVLPTLFTHEDRLIMSAEVWRGILSEVTSEILDYYPEYDIIFKSMDDACQYMRAKVDLKIKNVTTEEGLIAVSVAGENDIPTKCYIFTEEDDQIHFKMITLPKVTDSENPIVISILHE